VDTGDLPMNFELREVEMQGKKILTPVTERSPKNIETVEGNGSGETNRTGNHDKKREETGPRKNTL